MGFPVKKKYKKFPVWTVYGWDGIMRDHVVGGKGLKDTTGKGCSMVDSGRNLVQGELTGLYKDDSS